MTVLLETKIQRWIGLSTDTKPSSSVPVGATFWESDSKLLYRYTGSAWAVLELSYGLAFAGTCDSSMTQSTTTIPVADLAGYGNDYFNTKFYLQVIKNNNSVGNAPENEIRQITDYVSATGTFTTNAFSVNVQASDEIMILHSTIASLSSGSTTTIAGEYNVFTKAVTSAANAGDVVIGTITSQACQIERVTLRSVTASQTDLTSAGIFGGASKIITFIPADQALVGFLDAVDEQISYEGCVVLPATKTIVISLVGTGATAVNLSVEIGYRPLVDGGYLI